MKMTFFWILSLFLVTQAHSSTFVGNGGNAGDVELQVVKNQIEDVLDYIGKNDFPEGLCECESQFKLSSMCAILNDLSSDQKKVCQNLILKNISVLKDKIHSENGIKFLWSSEGFRSSQNNNYNHFDAVANTSENTITIHKSAFRSLSPPERMFLLSHELFHFIEWDGSQLTDEINKSPFNGPEKSRKLVNAMASSLVMESNSNKLFKKYNRALNRSQNWRHFWIDLNGGEGSQSDSHENNYYIKQSSYFSWNLRYQWDNGLGVFGSYYGLNSENTIYDTIKLKEKVKAYGLGFSYRKSFFKNPLTALGQSHLVAQVSVEKFDSAYQINEGSLGLDYSSDGIGGRVSILYFMPLIYRTWVHFGVNQSYYPREYKDIGLKYESTFTSFILGVSVGF